MISLQNSTLSNLLFAMIITGSVELVSIVTNLYSMCHPVICFVLVLSLSALLFTSPDDVVTVIEA